MGLSNQSLTSDRSYLKIHLEDSITIDANGVPDSDSTYPADSDPPTYANSVIVNHGLGYKPLVRAFWDAEKNGVWHSSYPGNFNRLKVIITDTYVKFIMGSAWLAADTAIPVFYRIYDTGDVASSSDSRMDKIFFKDESDVVAIGSGTEWVNQDTTFTIPHGDTTAPLYDVEISRDGVNWFGNGITDRGADGPSPGQFKFSKAVARADKDNVYVTVYHNYGTDLNIKLRVTADKRT